MLWLGIYRGGVRIDDVLVVGCYVQINGEVGRLVLIGVWRDSVCLVIEV